MLPRPPWREQAQLEKDVVVESRFSRVTQVWKLALGILRWTGGKGPRIRGLKHVKLKLHVNTCSMLVFGCSTNFCQSCSCLTYPQVTGRLSMRRAHVCGPPNCSGAQKVPSATIKCRFCKSAHGRFGSWWKSERFLVFRELGQQLRCVTLKA